VEERELVEKMNGLRGERAPLLEAERGSVSLSFFSIHSSNFSFMFSTIFHPFVLYSVYSFSFLRLCMVCCLRLHYDWSFKLKSHPPQFMLICYMHLLQYTKTAKIILYMFLNQHLSLYTCITLFFF
jgi:hypothetical protein